MPRPNFFIVGAPKCGTTAMYKYLSAHPEVFMSDTKEPNYFGQDLGIDPQWHIRDEEEYLKLFDNASEKCVGEASVWYLYSQGAARRIRKFAPDAKILIMLRNPPDMIYSLHRQSLWTCNEDIHDFEEALDAENDRREGRRIPEESRFPQSVLYTQIAKFADQVRRYLDLFPKDKVHIVLFDDFAADTEKVYNEVLEFLEISTEFTPDLEPVNQAKPLILRPINAFLVRHPWLKKASRRLIPFATLARLMDAMPRALRSAGRPAPMTDAARSRLTRKCRPDVERLTRLIGRDLSAWSE
jgi:hypothetical protein